MIIHHAHNGRSILKRDSGSEFPGSTAYQFTREDPVVGMVHLVNFRDYIGDPPAIPLSLKPAMSDLLDYRALAIYGSSWHLRFLCAWRLRSKETGYLASDLWLDKQGLMELVGESPQKIVVTPSGEVEDVSIHFRSGIVLDIFSLTPPYSWIFESRPFQMSDSSEILHQ